MLSATLVRELDALLLVPSLIQDVERLRHLASCFLPR